MTQSPHVPTSEHDQVHPSGFHHTVTLPRVVGTRPSAQHYLDMLPQSLLEQDVLLDCGGLVEGTASFADEVVKVVLATRNAARLVAYASGSEFAHDLQVAAQEHHVSDRLHLERVITHIGS